MSDTTRRDFLKTTSTAALSAGLLGSISTGAFAQGSDRIRIGVIGCGGRGGGAVEDALKGPGYLQLTGMADAFDSQLQGSLGSLKRQFEKTPEKVAIDPQMMFAGLDGYKKLLASDEVDLVILATPPGLRPTHFEAAIKAGKHVFMEKPVASDSHGVRQVLAAAELADQKGLKVGVGLQRRHQNCYLDIIQRIHDGAIGDIAAMRVYWNGGGVWGPGDGYHLVREQCQTEMEYQLRNWYYYTWLCGDHICEQHIHNIDIGLWAKQALPVKARGTGGREVRKDKKFGEIFDHHCVQFFFEDGSFMYSECRHIGNTQSDVSEHFHGTKGIAALNNNSQARDNWIRPTGGERYAFRDRNPNPYEVEHEKLIAAIRENKPYNEARYGAHSTMAAILGRMCTYSGQEITWDDALNRGIRLTPENVADITFDSTPPVLPDADGVYAVPVPGVTKVLG
jgi:predicted dehydrogenase